MLHFAAALVGGVLGLRIGARIAGALRAYIQLPAPSANRSGRRRRWFEVGAAAPMDAD